MEAVQRPIERRSFWDRPLATVLPIDRELALYIGLVTVGAILRFWDLGSRILHHDESLHAVYSYGLYIGKGYEHDPMMHGPFQFHWYALWQFLFGATDATVRMGNAFLGAAMVLLPYFFRRYIGRTPALVATVLIAFSPTLLYFSRFAREDMPSLWWTAIFFLFVFRYLEKQEARWLYLAAGALSLVFSTKENSYIIAAIAIAFLAFIDWSSRRQQWYWYALMLSPLPIWFLLSLSLPARYNIFSVTPVAILGGLVVLQTVYRAVLKREQLSPAAALLFVVGTLITPLFTAVVTAVPNAFQDNTMLFGLFLVVLAVTAVVGTRWNARQWLWSALIFWGIFFVLHTTFFANPNGVISGSVGALKYWIAQQEVARGSQPWFYYLLLMPLYEFIPLLFGLGGMIYIAMKRNNLFAMFLAFWVAMSFALYGYASEKMPWLVIHTSLPMVMIAAYAIGRLFDTISWKNVARNGAVQQITALGLGFVMLLTLIGRGLPFTGQLTQTDVQQKVFPWIAYLAIFVGLIYVVYYFGKRLGWAKSLQLAAVAGLALLMPFSVRTAVVANYYNGDVPVEMTVYTQTSPDVGQVMSEIERLAFRTGEGKEKFKVAYDSGVSWPFEWYLRDYKNKNFFGWGTPAADAPVVLVGFERDHDKEVARVLGSKYVGQRYRLRWWFPEDYRSFNVSGIINGLLNPDVRTKVWRYFLYRETVNALGSTDFMVYIRRDLATGPWAAPQATAQTASEETLLSKQRDITAAQVIGAGQSGNQPGQFANPKNVAIGPDGSIYVADSFNHRIQKLDQNGQVLKVWGSEGPGQGQLKEPWGVAVDPKGFIYVADTWNHRVQKFDLDGNFVAKIGPEQISVGGEPGQFFGPRGLAVDAQGNLYVTDTGNHRVQKFSPNGEFIAQFGSRGAGDGLLNEPVGIAIDNQGNILIADTWNQRVQKFNPQFQSVASWPIAGWNSQSVVNKPYIAVDKDNNFYITDPENHRVTKYGPDGQPRIAWGKPGEDQVSVRLPTGIGVDGEGNVFVADSQNNRILRYPPIK